jgi:hypothetical protein
MDAEPAMASGADGWKKMRLGFSKPLVLFSFTPDNHH